MIIPPLGTQARATISPDGVYRYSLLRRWAEDGPALRWIMLNPSTADAHTDDPTIRRCCAFARQWGYEAIVVHNLYALRATDPRELRRHPDPIGPDNDIHLRGGYTGGILDTVCAWGAHADPDRAENVVAQLRVTGHRPMCLGRTKAGQPRHPLYIASKTPLVEMAS